MEAHEIKYVVLGKGVTSIEDECFYGMPNLEEVDFSNISVDISIPYRCFKNCKALKRCIIGKVSDET